MVILLTEDILGNASPLKPMVATSSNSNNEEILLVA